MTRVPPWVARNDTRRARPGRFVGEHTGTMVTRAGIAGLLGLLFRHRKPVIIGVTALLMVDALQMVVPKTTKLVINSITRGSATPSSLVLLGLCVVGAAVGMGTFRFVWRYFLIGAAHKIERDIRQDLYTHLQTLPPQYFDHHKVGDLMSHATNDTNAVRRAVGFATLSAVDSTFLSMITLAMMCTISIKLTLLTLIPLPLLSLIMIRFGRIIHDKYEQVQASFSAMTDKAQETFSGIRVVKAYGSEEAEFASFSRKAKDYLDENVNLARIDALFDPVIGALSVSSMALLVYFGGRGVIGGTIRLGEFVEFSLYLQMLIWPMIAAGMVVNLLQRGAASMERLQAILSTQPAIVAGPVEAPQSPALECRNLSFTYPGTAPPVLRGVAFSLAAGTTLGIVGRTGCGKTTLVELLMRLYEPPRDAVLVGSTDVTTLSLAGLRGMFGYVPQEPFLFAMSVEDNIRFGTPGISRDDVVALARQVNLHDEICAFPQGYDTLVGERGITLSGGQKQRVAIARALALSPAILILDDALSAVDAETETAILDHLGSAMARRTCIVIAHRISAVKNADRIIVLDGGMVIDSGTHAELAGREGYYAELHRLQSLAEAEAASLYGAAR